MPSRSLYRPTSAIGIPLPSSTTDSDIEHHEGSPRAATALERDDLAGTGQRAPRLGRALLPLQEHFIAVDRLKMHYSALALLATFALVFFLLGWLSGPPEARSEFFGASAVCLVAFTLSVTAGAAQTGLVWILQPLIVVMGLFAVAAIAQRKPETTITLQQPPPPAYTVVVAQGT